MPRIPYPDPSTLSADTQKLLDRQAPLNIFRMMGHAEHVMKPFLQLGAAFLQHGKLDPITRECVVLRVGYLSNAAYETSQHEAIGLVIGMDEPLFAALREGPAAKSLTQEQRIAVAFTDHLMANPRPSDEAMAPALKHFGPSGLQELTLLIGYYMMVCRYLETFGVDVEEGGAKGGEIAKANT